MEDVHFIGHKNLQTSKQKNRFTSGIEAAKVRLILLCMMALKPGHPSPHIPSMCQGSLVHPKDICIFYLHKVGTGARYRHWVGELGQTVRAISQKYRILKLAGTPSVIESSSFLSKKFQLKQPGRRPYTLRNRNPI